MAEYNDILQSATDLAVLASDRANAASKVIHDVAHGAETETITTEGGEVSSVAKAIKDITDRIEAASLAPEIEPVEIQAGQLEYVLSTMDTSGMALYIEGSREFDFTVVDGTTFRLPREFPTGTRAWAVKRDIYTPNDDGSTGGGTGGDAETLNGYTSDQFLRADTHNAYDYRFIFGVDQATLGSVRVERDAANDRFRMLPTDGVEWQFTDGFGHQQGRWYFDNAPMVDNGFELYHGGNDGEGSGLDADYWRGLGPESFARTDSTSNYTGSSIYGALETAGSVRINHNGTSFSFTPTNGTEWDYNNQFYFENGEWHFDNAPVINGGYPVLEGNLISVKNVFGFGSTTTNIIDVAQASSFVVDASAEVTLEIQGIPSDAATTIVILAEGAGQVNFADSITWTDHTKPEQGAIWTLYTLTHVPTRGWYGSLGGRA